MALGGRDILRLIVDADSSGAIKEFNKLGKGIKDTAGDAEKQASGIRGSFGRAFDGLAQKSPMVSGALDKIGVSGSQAGAAIASAIPMAAVAAGGAIAAFAAKGISDFQNIALAAGKFSDASGLSVEQASKWIEVADHIGVSETAVSSAFRRMGVAIGNNTKGWQDLNVQAAKNADGSLNLSDTFLRVVTSLQAIEDPTKRAAAAQKLFGKGYAEVAELIGRSAPELADMLNEVGDAKVITPEELEKARAFRGAMDDLQDAVQEVGIVLGQSLVPQLTKLAAFATTGIDIAVNITGMDVGAGFKVGDLAKEAVTAINPMQRLQDVVVGLWNRYQGGEQVVKKVGVAFDATAKSASEMGSAVGPAATSTNDFARAADQADGMTRRFAGSADAVAESMGHESDAIHAANDALAEHTNATLAAFDSTFAIAKTTNDFAKALLEAETAAQDSTVSAGELQMKYDEQTQAAVAVAEAHVRLASDQAKATKSTFDAEDAQNVLIDSLKGMAAQATGPSKAALEGLIAKLQETGDQKPEPTVTLSDKASTPLSVVKGKVDGLDGRVAALTVNANTAEATRRVDALGAKINRVNVAGGGGLVYFGKRGGGVPGTPSEAVPAILHGGEYVLSADVVDRIKSGAPSQGAGGPAAFPSESNRGGAGRVTHITINTGIGDPVAIGRAVKQAVAAAERAGVN